MTEHFEGLSREKIEALAHVPEAKWYLIPPSLQRIVYDYYLWGTHDGRPGHDGDSPFFDYDSLNRLISECQDEIQENFSE